MRDLTGIYITANVISDEFSSNTEKQLWEATDIPFITVSHRPMDWGSKDTNLVVDFPRHQYSIYKQVLIGAKEAKTKYVAICEDDVLYSPEHFKFRPKDGHWGYNMNSWNIFTWVEPVFTQKPGGRRNLNGLICERQMLIDHLEERFREWPDPETINIDTFGEPGKYDAHLRTTHHPCEYFYPNPPNIVFSHEANLQYAGLGKRKGIGQIRALEIPYWGTAEKIRSFYV